MRKYIAECIGTFVLTFLGCATAMFVGCGTPAGLFATAAAFGLSVIAMAYTIGGISGCHINPAITLGVALSGRMSWKDACGYWCGQIIGAVIAGAVLLLFAKVMTPSAAFAGANPAGLGCNGVAGAGGDRHIGEPRPFDRSRPLRWRTGPQGSLGLHRRPSLRWCPQRHRLVRSRP